MSELKSHFEQIEQHNIKLHLKEVSWAHGGELDERLDGEDGGEEVVSVLGQVDHEVGHPVARRVGVVVVLDVVAVEAHEDDVDDDAERDGQLHEGVEHHEGQDLAQLQQGGCTQYGLGGTGLKGGYQNSLTW